MKTSRKFSITGLIVLFLISCALVPKESTSPVYKARVTAVIDGDTVKVQFDDELPDGCARIEKVRFIGVNTPELSTKPAEYYAQEARDFTNQTLYLQTVYLEFDTVSAHKDRYGRVLAYVYQDSSSISVNKQLILGGYGYYYGVFAFDESRMSEFRSAEEYARSNKKGLWK